MSATEIAIIKNQMENLVENFKEMKDENLAAHKEMRELFEKAMEEKAGRWVEKFVVGLISAICLSVLGAILSLVILK